MWSLVHYRKASILLQILMCLGELIVVIHLGLLGVGTSIAKFYVKVIMTWGQIVGAHLIGKVCDCTSIHKLMHPGVLYLKFGKH